MIIHSNCYRAIASEKKTKAPIKPIVKEEKVIVKPIILPKVEEKIVEEDIFEATDIDE